LSYTSQGVYFAIVACKRLPNPKKKGGDTESMEELNEEGHDDEGYYYEDEEEEEGGGVKLPAKNAHLYY
jgi:hypothetical protein